MTLRLKTKMWLLALVLGTLTALAGVLLVGVSSWFLASVALAGLGPAALAFNFHYPAALVRLLALTRTAGKYGERITGHEAALQDQAAHREALFERMAGADRTRARGWQLAQADQLEAFLGDVEADDFEPLRFSFPVAVTALCLALLLIATAATVPWALVAIVPAVLAISVISWLTAKRGARHDNAARDARGHVGRELGLALSGLVGLDVGAERDGELAGIVDKARRAEAQAARAQLNVGIGTAASGIFGPLVAAVVILVAWWLGARGEELLLPVLIAFSWLAFGELMGPISRQIFARQQAGAARLRLQAWSDCGVAHQPSDPILPDHVLLPLMNPAGRRLGDDLALPLKPGQPTAILGPSGCGKTTALKSLAGWLPWAGEGAHPLGSEAAARAMTHLSLHDAVIMRGTVRDNLFSAADDAELWHALRVVELEERVREAGGLDAPVRQDVWSLGEARRLELARVLLSDKPLVLLDEPGEHLRDDQAVRVLAGCLEHLKDRRVLFVTHQPLLANLASHWEVIG
ncbi:MAG: ATP-binding cassette domain-containing protein [Pseudomonadota bacterium]